MTHRMCSLLFLTLFGIAAKAQTNISPQSDWILGRATHFGSLQEPSVEVGGCEFGEMNPAAYPFYNLMIVSPDSELVFDKTMNGCGACYEIECADSVEVCGAPGSSVVVMIAGTCADGCGGTAVNLHIGAFEQIAGLKQGTMDIRLRQADCAPVDPIAVRVINYRVPDGGYIKFVIKNVPGDGGLISVELKGSGEAAGWVPAENDFGAAWEASSLPEAPLDMRLTNSQGQKLILKEIIKIPGFTGDTISNIQFPSAVGGSAGEDPTPNLSPPSILPADLPPPPQPLPPITEPVPPRVTAPSTSPTPAAPVVGTVQPFPFGSPVGATPAVVEPSPNVQSGTNPGLQGRTNPLIQQAQTNSPPRRTPVPSPAVLGP